MKRRMLFVLYAVCILALFSGCSSGENEIGDINDNTPIALLDDVVVYDYIDDDGALVFGLYDLSSRKQSDIVSVDGFYFSSGRPAVIGNSVILPVTLDTNEHDLLRVDAHFGTSEILFRERNPYPMDEVAVMNGDIYMLSTMKDGAATANYIRRYNEAVGNMDVCIEKKFTEAAGEQIMAFDCNHDYIYVAVNNAGMEKDAYVEIYDDKTYGLLGKLYFDSDLGNLVSGNGIAEFYCFDDYIYIRNYSDHGAIGKIENNQVNAFLYLPDLRMAHSGRNAQDGCYGFFIRNGREFYFLDVYEDTLYQTDIELSRDESIRNVISDGNRVCISILDEQDTESFTTKMNLLAELTELKEKAHQIK